MAANPFSSDDVELEKKITGTQDKHTDQMVEINVKPLLSMVKDVLQLAKPPSLSPDVDADDDSSTPAGDDQTPPNVDDRPKIVEMLALPIENISDMITSKCEAGQDPHAAAMDILKSLSSYNWDAKVIITLAAFAIKYGEFWLFERLRAKKHEVAHSIAVLLNLPEVTVWSRAGALKSSCDATALVLDAVMKVTECILLFNELPTDAVSRDSPEITAARIPLSVYWIVRSLLSASAITVLPNNHEYVTSTVDTWEIASLTHKLSGMLDHLQSQLKICEQVVEEKKALARLLDSAHIDNVKVLNAIIRSTENQRPRLYDGSAKKYVSLDVLRLKCVLFLITDLDVSVEELYLVNCIYYDLKSSQHGGGYEVVWLPVVESALSPSQEAAFHELRDNMPWYSVDHASLVGPVTIKFIRENWNFVHEPILVVLDQHGAISNLDALPMNYIWGNHAFPFTTARENTLWAESTWNIGLIVDAIDPLILEWVRDENKIVCMYGGDSIEWIRKFTATAKKAADALNIPLEMIYVGKANFDDDKVRKVNELIKVEKLSHFFYDIDCMWFFWARLKKMLSSKKKLGASIENDKIMQEVANLLGFDCRGKDWAFFGRGNLENMMASGDKLVRVLSDYDMWKGEVTSPNMLVPVLEARVRDFRRPFGNARLSISINDAASTYITSEKD